MSVRIENGAPPAALGAATEPDAMYRVLARVDQPCYVVATDRGIGLRMTPPQPGERLITAVGPLPAERLGASEFRARHGLRYAYVSGAMAAGIASEDLVIALSKSRSEEHTSELQSP